MTRRREVLLVEDDPEDADLAREAFKRGAPQVQLSAVEDGVQALAYLRREPPFGGADRPDLILLDLNVPRMDGREFLKEIKNDDHIKDIPVLVVTTSDAENDIMRCYKLGANCYLTKPVDIGEFFEIIRLIGLFWLSTAKLPSKSGAAE